MSIDRVRATSRRIRRIQQAAEELGSVTTLTEFQKQDIQLQCTSLRGEMTRQFLDAVSVGSTTDDVILDRILSGVGVIKYAQQKEWERLNRRH